MPPSPASTRETVHYYVDESGTPTLFGGRGQNLVGTDGCSKYFLLGKVAIDEPVALGQKLEALRQELLRDSYFKGVPSMQPSERKTAIAFHAKDDVPEVRYEVFKLLRRESITFYAVARDKSRLAAEVLERNRIDSGYRYKENDLYDGLVAKLFDGRLYKADHFEVTFAERGNSPRTQALNRAIEKAKRTFESRFGFSVGASIQITPSNPRVTVCLQVVDYYLWALQRFFEQGKDQYLNVIWPQTRLVHDLDDTRENSFGVCYSPTRPLTLEARAAKPKRKGRRI